VFQNTSFEQSSLYAKLDPQNPEELNHERQDKKQKFVMVCGVIILRVKFSVRGRQHTPLTRFGYRCTVLSG
jgi:hypothetical protein